MFSDVDAQLSHQCFRDGSGSLGIFGFPFFAIFASHLSAVLSLHDLSMVSSPDSSYDILNLAAIFVANSIPQNLTSDAS